MMNCFVVFCLVATEGLRHIAVPRSQQPVFAGTRPNGHRLRPTAFPEPKMIYASAAKDAAELPRVYGEGPHILGLQNCAAYREQKLTRMEIAGMPNSGTNMLWRTLYDNCIVPDAIATRYPGHHNIGWQAGHGKHNYLHIGQPAFKEQGQKTDIGMTWKPITKDKVIVTTVKDPIQWMASTCRAPYFNFHAGASDKCPSPVTQLSGRYFADSSFKSLPGIWSDWTGEYFRNNDLPIDQSNNESQPQALMVRFEDLLFKPEETVAQVCGCLGYGSKRGEEFQILESQAKWGRAHEGATNRSQTLKQYTLKRSALLARLTNEDKAFMKKTFEESQAEPILKEFHYDWSNPGLALYKTIEGKSTAEIDQLLASKDWGDEDEEEPSDQEMSDPTQ